MKTEKKNNRDYKYVTESEHNSSSHDEEDDDEEQMSTNEYAESTTIEKKSKSSKNNSTATANNSNKKQTKKRRSKRTNKKKSTTTASNSSNRIENNDLYTSSTKKSSSKSSNLTASSSHVDQTDKELKKVINDSFGYKIKEVDYIFIHDLMNDLVELHEIWDRIGFNKETKTSRLDKFYQTLHDTVSGVMESEQDLEEKILESIEQNKLQIKEMCIELHLKYDELKVFNQKQKLTILEEDELLRVEHKKLQEQKKKRLDQFKQLSKIENELCSKLGMRKLDIRSIVPTEQELNNLDRHIKDLDKVYNERKSQMEKLKEEIHQLSQDIEVTRSDSFAELILYEQVEQLSLSEEDINRALEFRDDLKRIENETLNEIRSLRLKIIELWSKLEIENLNLKPILLDTANCEEGSNQWSLPESMSKRTLVAELRKEFEHCVQVKTENMQKFIEKTRAEIKYYSERMYFGPEEMRRLEQDLFKHTNYNDDLLTLHEEKLDDLKFTFTEAETLFEKTQEWMNMWEKYMQFVETTKDPNRLKTRGYNMLKEEKTRNLFEKNLPKLEDEVNRAAIEYTNMNGGKMYTIYGSYYADYIQHVKNEFEENKKKEKLEKQIIRDNVRQNESRFGTKFVATAVGGGTTPLRNKRPLGNEKTPHDGKKKRTDVETTCINTPGSLLSNTRLATTQNKLAVPSAAAAAGTKTKLTLAKRKSKTPNARRLMRKSRQLANAAAVVASSLAPPSSNESTILSTRSSNYDQADTTIKSSNYSNISNSSTKVPKVTVTNTSNMSSQSQSHKYPPLSASSKYSSLNKYSTLSISSLNGLGSNRRMLQHMTSTAQNTFIEEENIENLEEYPDSINITKKINEKSIMSAHTTLGEVAAKMSKLITSTNSNDTSVASSTSSRFGFKYSENKAISNGKLDSLEVNYSDFTHKFNGIDATNKFGYNNGRSGMSTRNAAKSNDKLTSTLLKD